MLIPTFRATVLRRTIGASRLNLVAVPFLHLCYKILAFHELATLVASKDATGLKTKSFEMR